MVPNAEKAWAIRVQYDYIAVKGDTEGFHRVSGGMVMRIHKRK